MKEIAIYVEGGGDTAQQKAELRSGFDQLLHAQKKAARAKRLKFTTIPSGDRQRTFNAFIDDFKNTDGETVCILLVDSEEEIAPETNGKRDANAQMRKQHLVQREGWDLSGVPAHQIHLMVQCMEAWIVADPVALADYYGQGFHAKILPTRNNLEDEPKLDVCKKLKTATKKTQKGAYAKIKHASKLLGLIDPTKVSTRCSRFKTFTTWLTEIIEAA